jgi:hypothetical protein
VVSTAQACGLACWAGMRCTRGGWCWDLMPSACQPCSHTIIIAGTVNKLLKIYQEYSPSRAQLLIIDEASMLPSVYLLALAVTCMDGDGRMGAGLLLGGDHKWVPCQHCSLCPCCCCGLCALCPASTVPAGRIFFLPMEDRPSSPRPCWCPQAAVAHHQTRLCSRAAPLPPTLPCLHVCL